MILSIFNDICNCWWLYWLLPFLLGLLLGWLIWVRYRKYVSLYENSQRDLDMANTRIAELEADLKKCRSGKADYDSQIALLKGQLREFKNKSAASTSSSGFSAQTPVVAPKPVSNPSSTTGIASSKFAALKSDNLQVVEGIGPKMNEVLNKHGVHTWADLASKSSGDLRGILDTYGDRYRIIDPMTWSAQAKLADAGKWDDLIAMQKQLDTGRVGTAGLTDSKVEKIMIKLKILKRWKQDDLKAVEGIGPKIESLLHADGIKTWKALSETSVDRLQSILDKAGKRYKLAEPGTWPRQAAMAHEGKWDDLEAYQDNLNGGK